MAATELGELHGELREVARRLVGRAAVALGAASPPALDWSGLAAAGLLGLEVPDELGGAGATFAEVAVVLHELGRSPATGPYLGTVVLGAGALLLVDPGTRRDELLAALAAGEVTAAVALPGDAAPVAGGPAGASPPTAVPFRLERSRGRHHLSGRAELVPDAPGADRLLVPALDEGGGPVLVDLPAPAPGLGVTERSVLDATRRLGTVTATEVPVDPGSVWRFAGEPSAALAALFDRAATAVACDGLGLAEAMLEATVAYATERHQFGRPIGSFQAVQHACADLLVSVTVGRELVAMAVDAVAAAFTGPEATGPEATAPEATAPEATAPEATAPEAADADAADPDRAAERGVAVSMAKSHVCAAAVEVAGKAMQLHGGIGYTWESGVHAYLKRSALDRSLFGSPVAHRRRIGARYGEGAGPAGAH